MILNLYKNDSVACHGNGPGGGETPMILNYDENNIFECAIGSLMISIKKFR